LFLFCQQPLLLLIDARINLQQSIDAFLRLGRNEAQQLLFFPVPMKPSSLSEACYFFSAGKSDFRATQVWNKVKAGGVLLPHDPGGHCPEDANHVVASPLLLWWCPQQFQPVGHGFRGCPMGDSTKLSVPLDVFGLWKFCVAFHPLSLCLVLHAAIPQVRMVSCHVPTEPVHHHAGTLGWPGQGHGHNESSTMRVQAHMHSGGVS
jgi:hypothetical protein